MPDYASFKLTISVLTPLHIGSGRELLKDYDFAIHAQQTWRINDAALLDAQDVDDPALAQHLAETPPAQLLTDADFLPASPFFRYVINGEPRAQGEGAVVREQIKTTADEPYLPGSSLKGALRTALAWFAWGEKAAAQESNEANAPSFDPAALLGERARWAAQGIERQLFVAPEARRGHEANYELLKALQVSDSAPLNPDCLMLANASVLTGGGELGSDIPIEVEAIRPDTTFAMTLKIDLALLSDWARERGMSLPGGNWLLALPAVLQAHIRQRMLQEAAWYQAMPTAHRLLAFYQQRLGDAPGPGQFLLQLGWGGGWDGKTFGSRLRANRPLMSDILNRREYRMVRGRRQPNDPFPVSRRVAVSPPADTPSVPVAPLGWVLASLEPLRVPAGWQAMTEQAAAALSPAALALMEPSPAPSPRRHPVSMRPNRPYEAAPAQVPAVKPRPTAPKAPPPPPPPAPVTASFSSLPKIGSRFFGLVLETDKSGMVWLEIPGLSADDVAIATLSPKDNPGLRAYKEEETVLCEVRALQEDPQKPGIWLVRCKISGDF